MIWPYKISSYRPHKVRVGAQVAIPVPNPGPLLLRHAASSSPVAHAEYLSHPESTSKAQHLSQSLNNLICGSHTSF